ncbi:MAG: hypothetical protein HKN68_21465, partial [Saprospiraceae bacterium]|nr:hypothetical protein [Saprospiraceae bacterium]
TILCTTADRYGLYPDIEHLFLLDGKNVEDYSQLLTIDKKINILHGQDFKREVFLGSHKGLAIIHFDENAIKKLLYKSDLESTYGASMRGIQELPDGTIFMSHETNVLYKLDLEGNLKKISDLLPYSVEEVNDWACSNQLLIHNNYVWMSGCNISDMAKGMIFRIDPISEEVTKIDMPYRIQSMDLDSEGIIWMVGNGELGDGHLIRFDPESLDYKLFSEEENPILESFPNYVKCIERGDIYIGTSDKGLIRFNPVDQSVKRYRIGNSQNGLSSNTIYVIHESQDGGIWCGTSEGLNRLDPDTDEIEHYSIRDGLSSNLVVGIIEDELGNFWLSSYYGMSYFDRGSGIFRNFTTDDGLSDNEFNRFSFFKDDEGMIYMGGINGVNIFDPETLLKSQRTDRLTLTSVNAFDQSLDTIFSNYNELDQNNGLNLPSEIGYLEVKVLLDDFNTPQDHQFFSWMKGLEADYQYVGNRPTIRYNKIPPGSYQLHIKGADSKGNFAANEIILSVMVALPYYETLWFRLLILLGISLIVWAVARFQYHQKLQKEKFRTKVSSDLHDEVSGQLASIATRTELLGMKMKDNGMRESMVEVASKSREVMSRVSDVLWSIDGRKDTFGDLEDRIKNHLDELFGDMEFKIKYRSSGIEPQTPLPQDVRENLYFLIKEAINNIAKHSNGDLISVSIDQENGKCVTIIYDNGNLNSGHNKKASGQGIENMKVRAERLKGQIIFDETDGYKVEFEMKGVG